MFFKNQALALFIIFLLIFSTGCTSNTPTALSNDNQFQGIWETEIIENEDGGYTQVVLNIVDDELLFQLRYYEMNTASYTIEEQSYAYIEDITSNNTMVHPYEIDYDAANVKEAVSVENKSYGEPIELIGEEIHLNIGNQTTLFKFKADVNIDKKLDPFENIEAIAKRANPEHLTVEEEIQKRKDELIEKQEKEKEKERQEAETIKNYPNLSEKELIKHSRISDNFSSKHQDLSIKAVRLTGKEVPEIIATYNKSGVDDNRQYTGIHAMLHVFQFDEKNEWVEIYNEEYGTELHYAGLFEIEELKNEQVVFMLTNGMLNGHQAVRVLFYLDKDNVIYDSEWGYDFSKSNELFGNIIHDTSTEKAGGELTTDSITNSFTFSSMISDENWTYVWDGSDFVLK